MVSRVLASSREKVLVDFPGLYCGRHYFYKDKEGTRVTGCLSKEGKIWLS